MRIGKLLLLAILLGSALQAQDSFYQLEGDTGVIAVFAECGRVSTENEVVLMNAGGGETTIKIPGRLSFGDVLCARNITSDLSLWAWRDLVVNGNISAARRNLMLRVSRFDGSTVARYQLRNAWPSAIHLDEKNREVIVLVVEDINRIGLLASTISWSAPASIGYGTALSAAQLNATANTAGSFVYTPGAGTILPAGPHTLSVSFTPTDPNFTSESATVALTVNKAPLQVIAEDKESIYLDPLPPLTARFSGFLLGQTAAVLSGAPALATIATATSAPGTYPITAGPGTLTAANYSFTFVAGTLTIVGPTSVLQEVVADLGALSGQAASQQDKQTLGKVTGHVQSALAPSLWRDATHVDTAKGETVFTQLKDGVVHLENLVRKNDGGLTVSALQETIDSILKTTRMLAVVAIADAEATAADPKTIAKAREDLARGDQLRASGKAQNAILEYRNAWKRFSA